MINHNFIDLFVLISFVEIGYPAPPSSQTDSAPSELEICHIFVLFSIKLNKKV